MKKLADLFKSWFLTMFIITATCLLVYVTIQQSLRLGANEAPKQLAVETLLRIQNGESITSITSVKKDVTESLMPFVMIYDKSKNLTGTTGLIETKNPSYPKGVLNHVSLLTDYRVTWAPTDNLRFASVVIKYDNGYIITAQSLSEVERTIDIIGREIFAGWVILALLSWLIIICLFGKNKKFN